MPVLVALGIIILIFYIGQETGLLQFAIWISASGILSAGIFRYLYIKYNISSFLVPNISGSEIGLGLDHKAIRDFEKQVNLGTIAVAVAVAVLFSLVIDTPDVSRFRDPLVGQVSLLFKIGGPIFAGIGSSLLQWAFSVEKMANARLSSLAGEFSSLTSELSAIERQIGTAASRLATASPPTRLPELVSVFRDLGREIVFEASRAQFQDGAGGVLAAARADLSAINAIADEIKKVELLHREVTDAVAASNLYSLFAQVNDVWSFINSPHLPDLLQQRDYDEIFSQVAAVKLELEALLERARVLQPEMPPAGPASIDIWDENIQLLSSDPGSIGIALARLASKRGDPPQRLRRVYLGLVKIYNTDQNEDGDVRRFQQINEAYSFLQQEGLAV